MKTSSPKSAFNTSLLAAGCFIPKNEKVSNMDGWRSILLDVHERYIPPSEEDIKKYKFEDYPKWTFELREHISTLLTLFNTNSRIFDVSILINNVGNVVAENVLVEFHAHGCRLLSRRFKENLEENTFKLLKFPAPPLPPKGQFQKTMYSVMDGIKKLEAHKLATTPFNSNYLQNNNLTKDKNSFYNKLINHYSPLIALS